MIFNVYYTILSSALLVSAANFNHGGRALNGADDINAVRPLCKTDRYGNKHVPCPTPDQFNFGNWPCVKMADMCNMIKDCPNGEDEHFGYCIFHKDRTSEIDQLRETVRQIKG